MYKIDKDYKKPAYCNPLSVSTVFSCLFHSSFVLTTQLLTCNCAIVVQRVG